MLSYYLYLDTENSFDGITIYSKLTGDPFTAGTLVTGWTGEMNGTPFSDSRRLTVCQAATTTCAMGFRLQADGTGQRAGVGIVLFNLWALDNGVTSGANVYKVIDGTSMAAPHVAGLAALIRAYNPSFTYTDTVNALVNGGDSVSGSAANTKTGKAADALGSLNYVNAPSGFAIAVQ